jgi:hypothetical protein
MRLFTPKVRLSGKAFKISRITHDFAGDEYYDPAVKISGEFEGTKEHFEALFERIRENFDYPTTGETATV